MWFRVSLFRRLCTQLLYKWISTCLYKNGRWRLNSGDANSRVTVEIVYSKCKHVQFLPGAPILARAWLFHFPVFNRLLQIFFEISRSARRFLPWVWLTREISDVFKLSFFILLIKSLLFRFKGKIQDRCATLLTRYLSSSKQTKTLSFETNSRTTASLGSLFSPLGSFTKTLSPKSTCMYCECNLLSPLYLWVFPAIQLGQRVRPSPLRHYVLENMRRDRISPQPPLHLRVNSKKEWKKSSAKKNGFQDNKLHEVGYKKEAPW